MRLTRTHVVVGAAFTGVLALAAGGSIVPAVSAGEAKDRLWLAARASGLVAYAALVAVVVLGTLLSHPRNRTTWRLSARLFPWHEALTLFVLSFVAIHVGSLVVDPYAGVGIGGALIPGLSSYRSAPVALGVFALYAVILTALTARFVHLLPAGRWLTVHRAAMAVFMLAWVHGVQSGTDTPALWWMYAGTGVGVIVLVAWRHWTVGQAATAARASAS
jgi:methionine sulfoxide reductase heme-binding subunit